MPYRLVFCALVLAAPAASAADVYKWTDAAGVVHYSDTEPAPELKAERLHAAGTPRTSATAGAAADDGAASAADDAALQGNVVDAAQLAQVKCDQARSNLEVLQAKGAVGLAAGAQPQPLTPAEREAQIARAQSQIAAYCK